MKNYYNNILNWIFLAGIICTILFIFPGLDIQISEVFYNGQSAFTYGQNKFLLSVFHFVPLLTYTAAIIYITVLLCQFFFRRKVSKIILYLILTMVIGPGLIVNSLLKENFGRARPRDIIEFGGNLSFEKALIISNQCQTNCSFTSGHAAAAYYFTNLSFIVPRRRFARYFLPAMLYGTLVGIMRIAQGGHFASDIAFSCLIILLVNLLVKKLLFHSYFTK